MVRTESFWVVMQIPDSFRGGGGNMEHYSPQEDGNIRTPAHQAIEDDDLDGLVHLLRQGVDPDEVCDGMTLLLRAIDYEADTAIQGGEEMGSSFTKALLYYGADPLLRAPSGETPAEMAEYYGHKEALRILMGNTKGEKGE
ncbi:ankyrin repeat domain-containing protein [Streptomyces albidoflavus]|nr:MULTISPECIES: ankyrin repeat domain-containing protein [unclassified Streptomyces]MCQ9707784.1 ankyrin repeat domain-containing protein [Streptomyces sp. BSP1]UYX93190.1 ankyrin repeat domain-containing protein [Streptomyces sp. BI87]